eukprot:27328-Prymnesium_polylepis.1
MESARPWCASQDARPTHREHRQKGARKAENLTHKRIGMPKGRSSRVTYFAAFQVLHVSCRFNSSGRFNK